MIHPKACREALAAAGEKRRRSRELVDKALAHYPVSRKTRLIERVAMRPDPFDDAVLSSYAVRTVFEAAMINACLELYDRKRHDVGNRFFLFTFSPADGFTYEDAPVFEYDKLKRKTRHLLKKLGMDAICVFEVDILAKRLEGEHARRIILHVHAVCWTRDGKFKPTKMGRKLSARPEYANPLGVPAVSFRSRARARATHPADGPLASALHKHPDRDQTARSMAWLAHYLTKAPAYAKNRFEDANGIPRVRYDAGHFTLRCALRLNEIMSHFTPEQMMFSVGDEGNEVRLAIRKAVRRAFPSAWGKGNREKAAASLAASWEAFFDDHDLGFSPSVVHRRRESASRHRK